MNSFGRVVATIALLLLAAAGLSMSLCGGFFTLAALTSREMSGVWVISVPCLAIGAVVAWFAIRIFGKRLRRPRGG